MPIIKKKQKQLKPARVLTLSLLGVTIAGTLLLCLPFSSRDGSWTNLVDSFFTAVSATSVTGIALFNTFTKWTVFGQTVIMLLMEIGGLGLVTIVTFFNLAIGRKIGMVRTNALVGDLSVTGFLGSKRLFIRIVVYTLTMEFVGAALLCITFVPEYGAYGVFMSLFMAVSSFCNAGFDVMGETGAIAYADKPQVLIVMMLLIFLGGIGFVVWDDFVNYHKTKKLLMHTKLVLVTSGILLLVGFASYLTATFMEREHFADMDTWELVLSSAFSSVSARTAGFSIGDLPFSNDFAKMITIFLMFIGGSPGSTAGGLKVTTLAILIATVGSVIRGRDDSSIMGHRVPKKLVYKSVTVLVLSFGFIIIAFAAIYLLNSGLNEINILYEVVSAFTTTGFSSGISVEVDWITKLIICFTMFVGRIGPVSLLLTLTGDKSGEGKNKIMPDCEILIG